jgi:WS/DGAT/MGAT family acyltransferase
VELMSALDASFLHLETANTPMHLGWVGIFEGPPPAWEELVALVEANLALVPRYRRKLRFVPLGVSRPRWVDDRHFNLAYHLRHSGLPAPGGEQQLRNLVGRVMSQRLDRARPLWEMWIVEGLPERRWALLSKLHHCMVDGVSAIDLATVMFDRSPAGEPAGSAARWQPAREPRTAELLASAVVERLTSSVEIMRSVGRGARAPRQLGTSTIATARGLLTTRGLVGRTPPVSINGPLGPHRRWAWAQVTLADAKAVRGALGGTVNDVLLTVITSGFRSLLLARGEPVEGRVLRTLVPVSVRTPGQQGAYDNRVSAMVAALPVGIASPAQRLNSIRTQMQSLKDSGQAVAGEVLTSLGGFAPPLLLALAERVVAHVPQRTINTVATNVPGPQYPLYAVGRRMLEAFPYVPLGGRVRVGVAILSYDGGLRFGVTGDWDTAPDLDVLCAGIEHGIDELLHAAAATPPQRAAPAEPVASQHPRNRQDT